VRRAAGGVWRAAGGVRRAACGVRCGALVRGTGFVRLPRSDLKPHTVIIKQTMMTHGGSLIKSERCSVFVVDHNSKEVWSKFGGGLDKDDVIRLPWDKGM
jgi:hypothetical protein